ncbi:GGDEF domain-containing protein [Saccharopolyspora sp. NPDC000995]
MSRELDDPVGEAAALRSLVGASETARRVLQIGLGQALEQRCDGHPGAAPGVRRAAGRVPGPAAGLLDRRGVEHRASAADQIAVRWLVVMDIDNFKEINDAAGHTTGDADLQELAQLLWRECRSDDLVCRWAGDEFVVLLADREPDPDPDGPEVAERIRAAPRWKPTTGRRNWAREPDRRPSASGVPAGPIHFDPLFAAADRALYRAKHADRNRVEVESNPALPPAAT